MSEYEKEIYLSLFLNRSKRCYTIISSAEGGVEIESVKNQVIREVGSGDVTKKVAEDNAIWYKFSSRSANCLRQK